MRCPRPGSALQRPQGWWEGRAALGGSARLVWGAGGGKGPGQDDHNLREERPGRRKALDAAAWFGQGQEQMKPTEGAGVPREMTSHGNTVWGDDVPQPPGKAGMAQCQ